MKKVQVEVTNATGQGAPLKFSESVLREVIQEIEDKKIVDLPDKIVVSIAFVDKDKIKQFNEKYRKKDETTDVLSFCYEKKHDTIVGEMLLCESVINENAKMDEVAGDMELRKNIIHGFLHILGFEHGKKMFSIQNALI